MIVSFSRNELFHHRAFFLLIPLFFIVYPSFFIVNLYRPVNLHPNFWKSRSWEIKVYFKFKKKSVAKNCSNLSLFEQIVLVISKFCKFSAFSLKFQKFFSISRTFFYSQWVRTILVTKYHCVDIAPIQKSKFLGWLEWLKATFN